MILDRALDLARTGRLYPGVILDGADAATRRDAALRIAKTLLCSADSATRPCGACRACQRIDWPAGKKSARSDAFFPDFHVLERDRRASTSADATRGFLDAAYQAPFEAGGQVFIVAEASTLTPGAANALLKILEEPPRRSPRHFLLLCASRRELLPTLRSRALSLYLGPATALDADHVAQVAEDFGNALDRYLEAGAAVDLLLASEALGGAGGFEDPTARRPWAMAAAAIVADLDDRQRPSAARRALLETAADFLDAPRWRMRGIPHGRILDGILARRLG